MTRVYDFEAQTIQGKTVALSTYEGKAMLIVNTASACGFTPQFAGLEDLHKEYGARGLVVLGFPCNQFGGQEPGTPQQIYEKATKEYGVNFPLL